MPGHWEGDLISGSKNSHIATLVERHSRYVALVKVKNKETATVVAALTRQIRRLPTSLRRSLTWDRGHEMSTHKACTVATDVQVYFCDPSSPWDLENAYDDSAAERKLLAGLVGRDGLEPSTNGLKVQCSTN